MSDAILTRREGSVLVLVNNNPKARNALTTAVYEELPWRWPRRKRTRRSVRSC